MMHLFIVCAWIIGGFLLLAVVAGISPVVARVRFGSGAPLFFEGWYLHPWLVRCVYEEKHMKIVLLNHWIFGDASGYEAEYHSVNKDSADAYTDPMDAYWRDSKAEPLHASSVSADNGASFNPAPRSDSVVPSASGINSGDDPVESSDRIDDGSSENMESAESGVSSILQKILGLPLLLLKLMVSLFEGVSKFFRSLLSLYEKIRGLFEEGARWLAFLEEHTVLYRKIFRWLVRILRAFFRMAALDEGVIRIESGLGNPFHTGLLSAACAPFLGSSQASRRMEFVPDFSDTASFVASGNATVRTSILMLVWPVIVAIITFPWLRALWFYWRFRRFRATRVPSTADSKSPAPAS